MRWPRCAISHHTGLKPVVELVAAIDLATMLCFAAVFVLLGVLERNCSLMNAHARDALLDGHQTLIPALELPDPMTAFVVAAAIKCRTDLILTLASMSFRMSPWRALGLAPVI